MSDYIINIEGGFTTSVFYTKVLKELHNCLVDSKDNRVVFNLTKTTYIDPLVIPNLLCTGHILKEANGKLPIIATVDQSLYTSNSKISQYLREIGFLYYSEKYGLFSFYALDDKRDRIVSEYSTTFSFNYDANADSRITKQQIAATISKRSEKLFKYYLNDYYDYDDTFGYGNKFAKFGAELCHNASIHGETKMGGDKSAQRNNFAFMTIQSNVVRQIVSIAVSDCGCGFYNSWYKRILERKNNKKLADGTYQLLTKDEEYFLDKNNKDLMLLAILESAFCRFFDSEYGIWNIAKMVLSDGGLIRIHSSDSRIILTPASFSFLNLIETREKLRAYLLNEFLKSKNYKYHTNLKYRGVHVEIEMPMKLGKRGISHDYL